MRSGTRRLFSPEPTLVSWRMPINSLMAMTRSYTTAARICLVTFSLAVRDRDAPQQNTSRTFVRKRDISRTVKRDKPAAPAYRTRLALAGLPLDAFYLVTLRARMYHDGGRRGALTVTRQRGRSSYLRTCQRHLTSPQLRRAAAIPSRLRSLCRADLPVRLRWAAANLPARFSYVNALLPTPSRATKHTLWFTSPAFLSR